MPIQHSIAHYRQQSPKRAAWRNLKNHLLEVFKEKPLHKAVVQSLYLGPKGHSLSYELLAIELRKDSFLQGMVSGATEEMAKETLKDVMTEIGKYQYERTKQAG